LNQQTPLSPPRAPAPAVGLLALLSAAQFLIALDFSIVNIALPEMQQALGFSDESIQWVITAYAVPFGGLLLVGGKAADLYGRARVLILGLLGFSGAAFLGGIASSAEVLVAARGLQGASAALAAPAALSLVTSTFREGPEREWALGVYGTVLSLGFVTGVVLGGVITSLGGWRAVMLVNVPAGFVLAVLAVRILSNVPKQGADSRIDIAGAVLATAGLVLLLYGLSGANSTGWGSVHTVATVAAAIALLGAFCAVEVRAWDPILPSRLFRESSIGQASAGVAVGGALATGSTVVLSLYTQQALGYTPIEAGIAFTALGGAAAAAGGVTPRIIRTLGPETTAAAGLLAQGGGAIALVAISSEGRLDVFLAGTAVMGFGHVMLIVACTTLASAGVEPSDHGLAGGVINAALEVGSGVGAAVFVGATVAWRDGLLPLGRVDPDAHAAALTDGTRYSLACGGALVVWAGVTWLVRGRRRRA
jgi:MFS family permease